MAKNAVEKFQPLLPSTEAITDSIGWWEAKASIVNNTRSYGRDQQTDFQRPHNAII
jgi:hypothetical protein